MFLFVCFTINFEDWLINCNSMNLVVREITYLVCKMPTEWQIWPFLELQFIKHVSHLWQDKICDIFKFWLMRISIKRGIYQLQGRFWALWTAALQNAFGFLQNKLTWLVRRNRWSDLVFYRTDWWGKWGEIDGQTCFFTEQTDEASEEKYMVRLGFLQNRLMRRVRRNIWLSLVFKITI